MFGGAPSCDGQAASYGGQTQGKCRISYVIITNPGNLSIGIYKGFRCYEIASSGPKSGGQQTKVGSKDALRTSVGKANPHLSRGAKDGPPAS